MLAQRQILWFVNCYHTLYYVYLPWWMRLAESGRKYSQGLLQPPRRKLKYDVCTLPAPFVPGWTHAVHSDNASVSSDHGVQALSVHTTPDLSLSHYTLDN